MDASRRTMHGLTIIAFCIDVAISSQKIVSFKFPCNAAFCELSVVHYEIQSQRGRMLKWNSSVPQPCVVLQLCESQGRDGVCRSLTQTSFIVWILRIL